VTSSCGPGPGRGRLPPPRSSSGFGLVLCIAAALSLGACSGTPRRDAPLPPTVEQETPPRGGYYLDDGPGHKPPAELDNIPDAVPRVEPLHPGASRPYTVMGRSYTPKAALQPYKARGIATWYGRRYHGKQTSSGEIYDMYAMTAAHTTLPIPSYARVTHLANGKSVVVRVNDRGPFIGERLIDLSYAAAHRIGLLADGSAMVEVESVLPEEIAPPVAAAAPAEPPAAPQDRAVAAAPEPEPVVEAPAAPQPPPAIRATPAAHPAAVAPRASGIYLQLGAFGSEENAENYLTKLKAQLAWLAERLHIFPYGGLHRVHAGPFASQAEAQQSAERIREFLGIRPIVLTR
jgi:rare lipoprotein A